jgi:hypothetical protein
MTGRARNSLIGIKGAAAAAFGKIATGLSEGLNSIPAQFAVTTVVGGTVSVIGGGKFANGAAQAGFGYLFNHLAHSSGAKGYLDQLRASSPLAAQMLDALAADKSTTYYFDVGPLPESDGGGTVRILRQEPSLWDKIMGRGDAPSVTVVITVDPRSTVSFMDTNGQSFRPDTLRLLGHELGHAFTWYETRGNYVAYRASYNAAIGYENAIARQLNPNAPMRAVSDHGHGRP